jgi:hypothetical protein
MFTINSNRQEAGFCNTRRAALRARGAERRSPILLMPTCDIEALAYCAPDRRADGGLRNVWLTPRGVRIERAVSGIKMRLLIPFDAYQAILLTCDDADRRLSRISLTHSDPDLSVSVDQVPPAILEIWRSWARGTSAPALPGISRKAPAHRRRRGTSLAKRRPRILLRRQPGRPYLAFKVFQPVRELFSRE